MLRQLEALKAREHYLSFHPLMDVRLKMQELQRLKLGHNKILLLSENQTDEVEQMLGVYNQLVEKLSGEIIAYNNLVNAK